MPLYIFITTLIIIVSLLVDDDMLEIVLLLFALFLYCRNYCEERFVV